MTAAASGWLLALVGAGLRRPVVEQDLLVRMTQVEQPPGLLIEQVEVQTLAPKLGDAALQLAPLLGERGDLGAGSLDVGGALDPPEQPAFALW